MQHFRQHHHVDPTALTALLAGPIAFLAFAGLAIAVHDAPVAHAAHAALTGR
jgi:ABC-type enterobactin transport system permease subunit